MPITADAFLAAVRRLPLTPAQVSAVNAALASPGTRNLPEELVRREVLTEYQRDLLLAGKSAELIVGRYVILDKLGEGGMGQVVRARDTAMDRVIALKLIRPDRLARADAYNRFQQEVRAAARLTHPNIVRAYDAGTASGKHFLATEFVAGYDMAHELNRRGALPVGEACEYARQTALGLQHAHEKGLVHRDIKPANLLFSTAERQVKVADFGLARFEQVATTSGGLTADGVALGTPDYIAPEQADSATKADIRSDIYSLGCTLYHFLTGRVPFPGDGLSAKLVGHASKEPEPLSRACPGLSPALVAVVRKMMAKNPADRYQTPAEVASALAPFCLGPGAVTTDLSRPPSGSAPALLQPASRPAPPPIPSPAASTVGIHAQTTDLNRIPLPLDPYSVRKNRGLLYAGIGLGAGALIALVAVVVILVFNKESDPKVDVQANVTVPVNVVVKIDDWPKAREPGVVIYIDGAALTAAEKDKPRTADELKSPLALPPGRYTLVAKKDGKELEARAFDVTPEGADKPVSTRVAALPDPAGAPGEVRSWGAEAWVTDLHFYPDGKRFIAIGTCVFDPYSKTPGGYGWSPERIYDVNQPTQLDYAWISRDVFRMAVLRPPEVGLCFSADNTLATSVRRAYLFKTPGYVAANAARPVPPLHYAHLTSASATGDRVLWALTANNTQAPDNTIRLEAVTLNEKEEVALKALHTFPGSIACFDPSGRQVFVADKTALTLYAESDGKPVAQFAGATAPLVAVTAPDAARVAAGDEKGTVYIWNVASKNLIATAKGHTGRVAAVVFTPNGKRMISASWDGTVRVWDPATGSEVHKYKHDGPVYALAMSPGGKRVLSGGADKTIRLWQLPP